MPNCTLAVPVAFETLNCLAFTVQEIAREVSGDALRLLQDPGSWNAGRLFRETITDPGTSVESVGE